MNFPKKNIILHQNPYPHDVLEILLYKTAQSFNTRDSQNELSKKRISSSRLNTGDVHKDVLYEKAKDLFTSA